MATPTVTLDIVETSSFRKDGTIEDIGRGFRVDGLDTTLPPHALIHAALPLFDAPGTPHPSRPNCLFTGIEINGNLPDAVVGVARYTSLRGLTPTSFVLTRSTRTVIENTNVMLSGKPIVCSDLPSVQPDYINMTVRRPVIAYVAEGLRYGAPDYEAANYTGYVNAAPWRGAARGRALIDEFTTGYSPYQGYHTYRCVVISNVSGRDWSSFGILRHQTTNRYISSPSMDRDIEDALGLPYQVGQIGPNNRGFTRIGLYPTVDFVSVGLGAA